MTVEKNLMKLVKGIREKVSFLVNISPNELPTI